MLACGARTLDLSEPVVMGVLNVTPDSFSDGGRFAHRDAALRHAESMMADGAGIIDVGGESTRPGAQPVSLQQELDRVIPVVEALSALDVIISVDTSTPEVILAAASCGAGLINDVRALRRPGALAAAVDVDLPVCIMHMSGEPDTMQNRPSYTNVVDEVLEFLRQRMLVCVEAGIDPGKLLVDPGFGFGKTVQHNLQLLKCLDRFQKLDAPVLIGMSRKSMFQAVLGRDVDERLAGSVSAACLAVCAGASIVRAHDVKETVDAVRFARAVMGA